MNRQVHILILLAAIAALCVAPTTSSGGTLARLTQDSVIGGWSPGCVNDGGDFWDSTNPAGGESFNGRRITDGSLSEGWPAACWVVDSSTYGGIAYLVIDLGAPYFIDQIDLYNSYWNGTIGTGDFQIKASNSVYFDETSPGVPSGADYLLVPGTDTLILTDTLTQSTLPATGESFYPAPTVAYQYLEFKALSSFYDNPYRGLNEIEVYGTPVPEPNTLVLGALGLLSLLGFTRRRK